MIKQWSAVLPLALSIAGLVLIFGHVAVSGAGREADEGTAARVWWLLMAVQVPVVAYFAITWLPRAARTGLAVLALQIVGVVANLAAVRYFDL